MITWLDRLARGVVNQIDEKHHGGDPRKAFAYYVGQVVAFAQEGRSICDDLLDESFIAMVIPFIAEFLPPGASLTSSDGLPSPRPLGLLLTRATASLLSEAGTANFPDDLWRAELGSRAVYVDVPHGALLLNAGINGDDVLQVRAILAAPYLPPDRPGSTLFIAQITDRGSERGRGRITGVLQPDGKIWAFGNSTMTTATDWTLRPPYVHPLAEQSLRYHAGMFLRLVLGYYFFGPMEARQPIPATPTEKLRAGKPRKDESLFALTRLNQTASTGRPRDTIPGSWSLTSRQEVTGHFKLQPHGPGGSLRKMIWVASYDRGPENAPIKPQAYRI
jgi:hypothetical protein